MQNGKEGEQFFRDFTDTLDYVHTRMTPPGSTGALGSRYPDAIRTILEEQFLHEAKVGHVRGLFAQRQVLKDAALVADGQAKKATWHYFASARTGRIGPSPELIKLLEENGIDFYVHFHS